MSSNRRPTVIRGAANADATSRVRDTAGETRPRHGGRKRCSNPTNKPQGCNGWARRNSEPPSCATCGGGTRTSRKWNRDEEGTVTRRDTGLVRIPPRVLALINGDIDVDDLDDEELARGYPRAEDGTFRCPPNVVPRSLHNRLVRELFDRANRELKTGLVDTAKFMMSVVNNTELDAKVRLDAAKWVFERIMGKTPDVQITADAKRYEEVFERMDRAGAATIVEGDWVDDGREA